MNKIEHIGIAVKDLKKANQLYAQLFGEPHYKVEEVASEGVKTSFFKGLLGGKKSNEQLEDIIHKRIQIDANVLTKNFNYFIINALLYVDVLAYMEYLKNESISIDYIKNFSRSSFIFFTTFSFTLGIDLLAGVVAGFMVSIAVLVYDVLKFDLSIEDQGENQVLKFKGKLSFLDLPVLSKKLQNEDLSDSTNLEICLQEVEYLDPAINEHLNELKNKLEAEGKTIKIKYSKFNIH